MGRTGRFSKGGAGSHGHEDKTQLLKNFKHWQRCGGRTSLRPDGDGRDHGRAVPVMGVGRLEEGVPERTQHALIRVDSRWEGVSRQPHRRVLGEMGRKWQGQRLQGCWCTGRGALGAPPSSFLCFSAFSLFLLFHLPSQQVSCFPLPPSTHACAPASSLPPFLSASRSIRILLLSKCCGVFPAHEILHHKMLPSDFRPPSSYDLPPLLSQTSSKNHLFPCSRLPLPVLPTQLWNLPPHR